MRVRHSFLLPAITLCLSPLSTGVAAQTPEEIVRQAREAFEERMKDVENFWAKHRISGMAGTGGMESTVYYVRDEVDGQVIFRPEKTLVTIGGQTFDPEQMAAQMGAAGGAGAGQAGQGMRQESFDNNYFLRPEVARRMTYEGKEDVEGHGCHVLSITDFEGLDFPGMPGAREERGGFQPTLMRLSIDEDEHIFRKYYAEGLLTGMGEPVEMTTTAVFKDYRDTSGMLYPWRVEVSNTGLDQAMGAPLGGPPAGEQPEAAEVMPGLEDLPEAQREMLKGLLERQQAAAAGEGAGQSMSAVVETLEVVVNGGPPGGS